MFFFASSHLDGILPCSLLLLLLLFFLVFFTFLVINVTNWKQNNILLWFRFLYFVICQHSFLIFQPKTVAVKFVVRVCSLCFVASFRGVWKSRKCYFFFIIYMREYIFHIGFLFIAGIIKLTLQHLTCVMFFFFFRFCYCCFCCVLFHSS